MATVKLNTPTGLYVVGGLIALLWLKATLNGRTMGEEAAKTAWDATGGAVTTGAQKYAKDTYKAATDKADEEFISTVRGLTGVSPANFAEQQIIISYRPTASAWMDGLPILGLVPAAQAYLAAQAVKEYRSTNIGKSLKQWGVY
ncbi:hypothetical protein HQ393_04650 [Chitinibacter bivalviorum]|uniref:Uncharacterized protein n=1 Tax=Chitinibacter bivalviorum TaxID=2739434 RepID=A0A7H9BI27_9NEIS|nr:hypothetical protein [Chitinibacter bivalviorum]QLG87601.1 hypothetical protein HQ393_04650 [Chitinibacter bivalviorum]